MLIPVKCCAPLPATLPQLTACLFLLLSTIAVAATTTGKVVKENASAALIDLGDDVLCLELHTKMNSLNQEIITPGDGINGMNPGTDEPDTDLILGLVVIIFIVLAKGPHIHVINSCFQLFR